MGQEDLFQSIRNAVGKSLGIAEAETKLTGETRDVLSQLILTRRGDGEVVLDVAALKRASGEGHQWTSKEEQAQDRLINPTRLPQMLPSLQGLQSSQYLSFVQRPLERDGSNGKFLQDASLRLVAQYQAKDLAKERTRLFGHFQRYVAKLVIDDVLKAKHQIENPEELDKLRSETPPQQQFELASQVLETTTANVMNRLFKYAVALTLIERIKAKAAKVTKARPALESTFRKMGTQCSSAIAKNRLKDLFLGYQKDMQTLNQEYASLNALLIPILDKMRDDTFEPAYLNLHMQAAKIDAIATLWSIILADLKNPSSKGVTEQIKNMHTVFSG